MPGATSRSRNALVALAVLLLGLGLGACSDDDEGGDGASATSTTEATGSGTTEDDGTTTTTAAGGAGGTGGSTTTAAPSGSPTSTAPPAGGGDNERLIELSIVGGNVEGGVRREKVKVGQQVTLRVTSDVADELHVHTYDLTVDLVPGRSAELTFIANIPGIHEVELEERHRKVLDLEVSA
jgi:hypothetical protein